MKKKLKVTIKVIDNVDCKHPDTKIYIKENLKEKTFILEIYFVFESFERINVLPFHEFAILF